jgi:hypothetical protein
MYTISGRTDRPNYKPVPDLIGKMARLNPTHSLFELNGPNGYTDPRTILSSLVSVLPNLNNTGNKQPTNRLKYSFL